MHLPSGDIVAGYGGFGLKVMVTLREHNAVIMFERLDGEFPGANDISNVRALYARNPNIKSLVFVHCHKQNAMEQVLLL